MASEQALLGSSDTRRSENVEKWLDIQQFFYDKRGGKILGQNSYYWMMTTMFYAGFYISLLLFFVFCLAILMVSVDMIYPTCRHMDSPIKQNPGLTMRPVPDFESNLIRFQQGNPATYKPFTDHIQAYLDQYENENQVGENFVECDNGKEDTPEMNKKVCRFKLETFGEGCTWQKDYGYDEGQPCILFKLNKVYDWRPVAYEPSEVPPEVADIYTPGHVPITCEGEFDADRENIMNITISPSTGFPSFYYPYLNQEGFRSPLAMLKFANPTNGVLINIICKAWAKNIIHHRNDQQGLVRFQMLID